MHGLRESHECGVAGDGRAPRDWTAKPERCCINRSIETVLKKPTCVLLKCFKSSILRPLGIRNIGVKEKGRLRYNVTLIWERGAVSVGDTRGCYGGDGAGLGGWFPRWWG